MNNAFDPSFSRSLESQRTMRGDAPAPARRLRAGDVLLSRYTVLSELGEGGMGVVYKCLDQVGGIEVAVKCLPPELSRNEGEMEGIRENYGIVAKLHHSAISGLRQLERDPASGEYYLVMDLAEGEDLSAILRRRRGAPMPLEEALAILRPLASALDYAHGERVLHRDVKPANVKVRTLAAETQAVEGRKSNVKGRDSNLGPSDIGPSTRLRVQLLDFGLAAEVRSSMSRVSVRGHGGASGTPAYMAPEQWEARRPDFRTDQYALAVVAYQMLAGFLPFDSEDTDLLRRAVLSRAPDPVEGLPSAANAALLRALSKDPKERFSTCAAFVEALEGRDGSTSRPPDGRAAGASLPEKAGGASPSGEPQRESGMSGRALPPGAPQRSEEAARSASAPHQATPSVEDETALLDRKVVLAEALAAIPDADRADKEFAPFVQEATRAFRAAEEALKFGRIPAFAACLDRTDAALESLRRAKAKRKADAERKARVEEEQRRMEQEREAEEERKRREEAARIAREAEERRRQQQAREAALALEDAERQRTAEAEERGKLIRLTWCVIVGFVVVFFVIATVLARMDSSSADTAGENSTSSAIPIAAESSNPEAGAVRTVTVGNVAFTLNWCPPGSFTMGSPVGEDGRYGDEARHRVELTKGFWMGETEVTQGLWKEIMGVNPSSFQSGDDYPVECVSWDDCQDFLRKLNAKAPQGGWRFALPTEAQWEYACRAGSSRAFSGTGRLDDMGWHASNSGGSTHPVAQKKANAWGLFDMHGNVWEWCADGYGSYPSGIVTDPPEPSSGSGRVSRGGSWSNGTYDCRSANRGSFGPGSRSIGLGFRVALVPVQ